MAHASRMAVIGIVWVPVMDGPRFHGRCPPSASDKARWFASPHDAARDAVTARTRSFLGHGSS